MDMHYDTIASFSNQTMEFMIVPRLYRWDEISQKYQTRYDSGVKTGLEMFRATYTPENGT